MAAKKTVYVPDELLEELETGEKRNVSKLFQQFLQREVGPGRDTETRSVEFSRRLLPETATIEAFREWLAAAVEEQGGPSARRGPVSVALAVLVYQAMIEQSPELVDAFAEEWSRLDLPALVEEKLADVSFGPGERPLPPGKLTMFNVRPEKLVEEVAESLLKGLRDNKEMVLVAPGGTEESGDTTIITNMRGRLEQLTLSPDQVRRLRTQDPNELSALSQELGIPLQEVQRHAEAFARMAQDQQKPK